MIKMNSILKKSILFLILVSVVILSSCSKSGEEKVFEYEDKSISKSVYLCYYSKNKENFISTYKNYYSTYGDSFKAFFGFSPSNNSEYWETTFWSEKQTGSDKTMAQLLDESTIQACKEYLVYEKIASDYGYENLPDSIISQFEEIKKSSISKYGSYDSWNIATIGQYGITADELMSLSYVSSYGTVLPKFIFGEKGEKISDDDALKSLSKNVQFMYSVYYFHDEIPEDEQENISETTSDGDAVNNVEKTTAETDNENENNSEENNTSEEEPTIEDYNKHYKELMKKHYQEILNGEKEFEEVYKDSDDYSFMKDKAPNGVILSKDNFKDYFSVDATLYKSGDYIISENETGIFLIKFVDFTSDYIEAEKSQLINEKFSEILDSYFSKIQTNEEVLKMLLSENRG